MSGLIDSVDKAIAQADPDRADGFPPEARAAVLAVAKWMDHNLDGAWDFAERLRAEVAPPKPRLTDSQLAELEALAHGHRGEGTSTTQHLARGVLALFEMLREDSP